MAGSALDDDRLEAEGDDRVAWAATASPPRLARALAPERLTQLTAVEAKRALDVAEAAQAVQAKESVEPQATLAPTAASVSSLVICVQAGPFKPAQARRFKTRVANLDPSARQSRVETPYQEATSRLVYLPPNGGARRRPARTAELKERGVENFYIMQGDSALRRAISLGVFKTTARPRNW